MNKYQITLLLIAVFIIAGCSRKETERDVFTENETDLIEYPALEELSRFGINKQFVNFLRPSPDSGYVVFILDSTVRFGPGDELWLEEWSDDWFGLRSRKILFLYDPAADTLKKMAECEEVVNLYNKEDSSPVHAERWENIAELLWSPDGTRILLVKDREQDGIFSQDILIFRPNQDIPSFLDVFEVWKSLVSAYDGKKGTHVLDAAWIDSSSVSVVFSVIDAGAAPVEVIFDVGSGKAVSVSELQST